jgi:hypothetical protein
MCTVAFSRVSKPHTHITYMLRQCTSIVYLMPLIILETGIHSNTVGMIFFSSQRLCLIGVRHDMHIWG